MPLFLLEIGFEEMPSRFLDNLVQESRQAMEGLLTQAKLDFASVRAWATPRRLALLVEDLAEMQRQEVETITGPPASKGYDAAGNPTAAAKGFAKGQGLDLSEVFTITTEKGQYLAARKQSGGRKAMDLLPEACLEAIKRLSFAKKMRWGDLDFTFGRPIRWIVALFGDQVVPFEVARVASSRATRGHRVMGPGPWELAQAADYLSALRDKGQVILDQAERRASIMEQCAKAAGSVGGRPIIAPSLLDEVCGLVESPCVVLGAFDKRYLDLPREVLLTSMQTHQKSFGVEDANGRIMAHFLTTLGLVPKDLGLVRKGWERVLKARLEDARFFWTTDLASSFDAWLGKLDSVIFLAPLGSLGDKSRRVEALCGYLAGQVKPEITLELGQAGRLCKADLVTEMVGEFADLQGIMGGIYARCKGESDLVAQAMTEQYLPLGPDSPVPASLAGGLLSLADKMDTLAGCFGLDMIPTGAADPYALRRQALGICRTVMEHGLRLDLGELVDQALKTYGQVAWKLEPGLARAKLMDFFASRLKALFLGQGRSPQVVDAALGAGFSDVWALRERITALAEFSTRLNFDSDVQTFKRAANIIRKQAADLKLSGAYDRAGLVEPAELALADAWEQFRSQFDHLWLEDNFSGALGMLGELRPMVSSFFDQVMVMCEDQTLKLNRLNLLKSLVDRLGRMADFAALQI
jgi:glycyl-tRNA synthetase beta chain